MTTYNTFDGIPVAPWIADLLAQLNERRARNRASDDEVARLAFQYPQSDRAHCNPSRHHGARFASHLSVSPIGSSPL